MSTSPESAPAAVALPAELWLADLRRAARPQTAWLWHGYLAAGGVTLLTSQWKSGKTTLVSVLLAGCAATRATRRRRGTWSSS